MKSKKLVLHKFIFNFMYELIFEYEHNIYIKIFDNTVLYIL